MKQSSWARLVDALSGWLGACQMIKQKGEITYRIDMD